MGGGGAGAREVSFTVTLTVCPTCSVRAALVNNRIWRVSGPSVVRSLARAWVTVTMADPLASGFTVNCPLRAPVLKSLAEMLVPPITQ